VAVMYAGQIVELAPAGALLQRPLHPYTRALKEAVPRLGASAPRLTSIPGAVPGVGAGPPGCRFHPRCAWAQADCSLRVPELAEVEPGRLARCPYWNRPFPERLSQVEHPA
jgi:oligopeptide/dipeptide ABC transporter ATP-binding protein